VTNMKRFSTLELFILSCFDRGLQTPYDLQRQAGLSLGATSPALKRLLKARMLKRVTGSTASKRPRHQYSLSSEGKQSARDGWKDYLSDPIPPTDNDSLLRILDMATHYKATKSSMVEFLIRASESRRHAAELLATASYGSNEGALLSYPRLRAEFEKERLFCELTTISQIVTRMKRNSRPKMIQASLLNNNPR
jgi:DNA-binding PadR family transcriptional regulator